MRVSVRLTCGLSGEAVLVAPALVRADDHLPVVVGRLGRLQPVLRTTHTHGPPQSLCTTSSWLGSAATGGGNTCASMTALVR